MRLNPAATFQAMLVRSSPRASRSDRPSKAWSTMTVATTSAGTEGRPVRRGTDRRTARLRTGGAGARTRTMHRPLRDQVAAQGGGVEELRVGFAVSLHPPVLVPSRLKSRT